MTAHRRANCDPAGRDIDAGHDFLHKILRQFAADLVWPVVLADYAKLLMTET